MYVVCTCVSVCCVVTTLALQMIVCIHMPKSSGLFKYFCLFTFKARAVKGEINQKTKS